MARRLWSSLSLPRGKIPLYHRDYIAFPVSNCTCIHEIGTLHVHILIPRQSYSPVCNAKSGPEIPTGFVRERETPYIMV